MYHILYVDDEAALLEITKLFLEQEGHFSVEVITSAPAALSLMKSNNFDAIISDYQMPVMDGIAFLKQVRRAGNAIPFILFTGRGREEVVIQALNEGADFYLQKGGDPVPQFRELSHKVRQAIQRRKAEVSIRDHERREQDIINFLPDATLAIDTSGTVIAWNRAIEEMTGISADQMLGRGNYEYALPLYGERRPILIDLLFLGGDEFRDRYSGIVSDGSMIAAETTFPHTGGRPRTLWGKASFLYDQGGNVVGAIESIRDITERKAAEDALRETEGRFVAFMDHLPVTAFIKDEHSTNLFVNQRMEEIFGAREWIGKSVYEQFPREAAEKMVEDDQKTLRDGYRKTIEYLSEKNGSPRIFETHKFRLDRENKPPLIGGFAMDITDRKKVEDALRESEERFRKIFEVSPLGMTLVAPDFRFVSVNPAWMEMTGFTREELLRMSFKDITHPEYLAGDTEQMKKLAAGTIPVYSTEKRYIRKNGTILWGWIRVTTIRDFDGSMLFFAAQIEDISERKNVESALRESEEKYRELVENASSIILKWDKLGKITFINEFAQRFFGYNQDEIIGRSVMETIVPQTESGSDRDLGLMINEIISHSEDHFVNENENIARDGKRVWIRWQNRILFDENGKFSGLFSIGSDITERKRAEDALKESEEKYRVVVENSDNSVYIYRGERILFVNQRTTELTGFSHEELMEKNVWDLVHPLDRERMQESGKLRIAGKYLPPRFSGRIIRKNGEILTCEFFVNRILYRNQPAILGIVRDVSEQKMAQEALRESEERYHRLISSSFDAVILHQEGRIVMANEAAARIFGDASGDVLIAKPVIDCVFPKFRTTVAERIRRMLESPDQIEPPIEEQFVRNDGSIIDVEVMATTTQYEGKPAVMVVFRDITERKKMETALLENEKNFRDLYDNAPNAYYTINPDGLITQCNYRAGEILGVPSTEMIGKKISDFYANTPAGKEKAHRLFGAFRHGKGILHEELQMQRADGGLIWINLTVNTIQNSSGTITGSRTIITDISSRKLAEAALRVASDKLQLLSGITRHDIRNQIFTLRGAIALIEKDGQGQDLEKFAGIAKSALNTIESQIEFTREYGSLGTKAPLWQNAGDVFRSATRHFLMSDVALSIPGTGYEVFADLLLEKAFYNLIDNTLRHGGEVTTIDISFCETTEGLLVILEDNGRGVPSTDKELIFGKGFGKHTGLGLFFVREILAITGITIQESGEPEKGARFAILVPKGLFRPASP